MIDCKDLVTFYKGHIFKKKGIYIPFRPNNRCKLKKHRLNIKRFYHEQIAYHNKIKHFLFGQKHFITCIQIY